MLQTLERSRRCRKCGIEITHKGHDRVCNNCRKINSCLDCGKAIEPESKRCQSCSQIGNRNHQYGTNGELNPNYKDGRTNKDYFCQDCGETNDLEVHHKISISDMIKKYKIKNSLQAKNEPEFWMLENGITYCLDCHCLKDKARYFILKREES